MQSKAARQRPAWRPGAACRRSPRRLQLHGYRPKAERVLSRRHGEFLAPLSRMPTGLSATEYRFTRNLLLLVFAVQTGQRSGSRPYSLERGSCAADANSVKSAELRSAGEA